MARDLEQITHLTFDVGGTVFDERFRDQINAPTQAVIDWVTANGPELLRRIGGGTRMLVHGDYRMDNLTFYDGEETPVGMIDFQGVASGHPLTDVAYFLRPNLDPDAVDAAEDDLLHRYHAALLQHGVTDYPWEQLEREYDLA
jgi:aminoglycoside phosphotransferase (APT) family kinase protein